MNSNDVIFHINNGSFQDLVPQTKILTDDDVKNYREKGYTVEYTLDTFKEAYPKVSPEHLYYANDSTAAYYWDGLIIFPVHLYGKVFFTPNDCTMEEYIRTGIEITQKDIQNNDFSSVFFKLSDRMQIEYLKMLIELDVPNIYALFLDYYPKCTYGCSCLGVENLQKLMHKKTAEEKNRTREKISKLPEAVTVYRGVGTKSASIDSAFSWTLDIKIAARFAGMFDTEKAKIYKAKVKKEDILEYIEKLGEAECIIFPEKLYDIKVTELADLKLPE